jgi:hypothetical protein
MTFMLSELSIKLLSRISIYCMVDFTQRNWRWKRKKRKLEKNHGSLQKLENNTLPEKKAKIELRLDLIITSLIFELIYIFFLKCS